MTKTTKLTGKKFNTNEEFISHLMNFSRNGGMIQPYILEALRIYSEQVLRMSQEDQDRMNRGFISYGLWKSCAEETLEALAIQSGQPPA